MTIPYNSSIMVTNYLKAKDVASLGSEICE